MGSESDGYLLSHDYLEDTEIDGNGEHLGDSLAKELGPGFFELHRLKVESKRVFWRARRFSHNYGNHMLTVLETATTVRLLKEAFSKYGQHNVDCEVEKFCEYSREEFVCNCGFFETRQKLFGKKEK